MGEKLGAGADGTVYKCGLGGASLAVKVVPKEGRLSAWKEASLAERVAGHPNLVDLKDALLGRP